MYKRKINYIVITLSIVILVGVIFNYIYLLNGNDFSYNSTFRSIKIEGTKGVHGIAVFPNGIENRETINIIGEISSGSLFYTAGRLVLSCVTLFAGIFVGLLSFFVFQKDKKNKQKTIAFAFFAIACGNYMLVNSFNPYLSVLIESDMLCNFTTKSATFLLELTFCIYILYRIQKPKMVSIMGVMVILYQLIAIIAGGFTKINIVTIDHYYYMLNMIALIIGFIGVIGMSYECLSGKNKRQKASVGMIFVFVFSVTIYVILNALEIKIGRAIIYAGIFLSISLHIFSLLDYFAIEQRKKVKQYAIEKERMQIQLEVMRSQIKPHFLYNCLSVIRGLCINNPDRAYDALSNFSVYLRGNMDSLKSALPIPFEKELEHIENYLELEKLQFADRLSVIENYQAIDFKVPPLTIENLVENAVRHGIAMRPEGGTIYIASEETEDGYEIIVEDDGVGFDISKAIEKCLEKKQSDILKVKEQIEMIGGKLEIKSKLKEGTTAKVFVPKER